MSQIDPFDTLKLPDLAEQGFLVAPSPRVLGQKGQNGQHISVPLSKYFYCLSLSIFVVFRGPVETLSKREPPLFRTAPVYLPSVANPFAGLCIAVRKRQPVAIGNDKPLGASTNRIKQMRAST